MEATSVGTRGFCFLLSIVDAVMHLFKMKDLFSQPYETALSSQPSTESPWLKISFSPKVMFLSHCPHAITDHHWAITAWLLHPKSGPLCRAIPASEFPRALAEFLVRLHQSPASPLLKTASLPSILQVTTPEALPRKLPVRQSPFQSQIFGHSSLWYHPKCRLGPPCKMAEGHRLKPPQAQTSSPKSGIGPAIELPLAMWPFQTYYTRIKKNNSNKKTLMLKIIRAATHSIWKNGHKHRGKSFLKRHQALESNALRL